MFKANNVHLEELETIGSSQDDFNETFFDSFFDLNGAYQHKTPFNKLHMFIESEEFHKVMSASVNKSKGEILMMILKFAITFCLSRTAITSLLQLINALFAYPILPQSSYLIDTLFNTSSNAIFHGICPDCGLYLGTLERSSNFIHCNLCSIDIDTKNSSYHDFFVFFNVSLQISELVGSNSD